MGMGWTRRGLLGTSVGAGAGIVSLAAGPAASAATPGKGGAPTGADRGGLRVVAAKVEYAQHVLGTDNPTPCSPGS